MKNKIIALVLVSLISIQSFPTSIFASEQSTAEAIQSAKSYDGNDNFEESSQYKVNNMILDLVKSTVNGDTSFVYNNITMFAGDTLSQYCDAINKVKFGSNIIKKYTIEETLPANSSTGDTVIMANVTLDCGSETEAWLFEYHINLDGDIYGFNIWAY